MLLTLRRDDQTNDRTFGALFDGEKRVCETLELPWRNNERRVSCIPAGTYTARMEYSPVHKRSLYWLHDVPGRDAVEIHIGNTTKDTQGCILLGTVRSGDALGASRLAFGKFMSLMSEVPTFTFVVENA